MLNDNERWALRRLRRSQEQWRWRRWMGLVLALGLILFSIYLEGRSRGDVTAITEGRAVEMADRLVEGISFAQLCRYVGIISVIDVIRRWRGRPTDILLLKAFEPGSTKHEAA